MQTTLLGIAIALILAFLTALVGPFFIDWERYRGELEAHARALTGLELRLTGPIDARLLPTPSLMLQGIELGRPNEAGRLTARALRVEFALGPLVRGELRITEAELEGPEISAEIDQSGRLAWPIRNLEFSPQGIAVERLTISDGRAVLSDAASGSRLVLDQVVFRGELRSLAGPIKGEGAVIVSGQPYAYRIATGRIAEDSSMRVRVTVDPTGRALSAEADVSIVIEDGAPRFDGSLQLARPVGRAPAGGAALIIEPWRLTGRIKGDVRTARLEQIEFQYGPDERATKLRGGGSVTFGRQPQITGTLSSPQIDLDRLLAVPEPARRRPAAVISALAQAFDGTLRLPFPTTLTIAVDSLTLSGAILQRLTAEVKGEDDFLDINSFEFRAPGGTQVRLDGRVGHMPAGFTFQGSTKVASSDARALLAWLADRTDMQVGSGPMRLEGEVGFRHDGIGIDKLDFELDRMMLSGKLRYAWARDHRPARLDAALRSPGIDLDRVRFIAKAILGDTTLDWPREGALALGIDRVAVAGIEAKEADVNLLIDGDGIEIERLSVGDLGGASLTASGRVAMKARAPQGAVTVDFDARSLDGVLALAEKFAPQAADPLRQAAGRLMPARIQASLALGTARASAETNARLEIKGRAGALQVALRGEASAAAGAFKVDNLAALGAAKVHLTGQLDAENATALAELTGLDRFIAVDRGPGRLSFVAIGPLDGQLAVESRLAAGTLDLASNGTVRLPAVFGAKGVMGRGPSIGVALRVASANIVSPRPVPMGQRPEQLPASGEARLAWSEGKVVLTHLKGTIAGTSVGGWLGASTQQQPIRVEGEIEFGAADLPATLATLIGMPTSAGANGSALGDPAGRSHEVPAQSSAGYWPTEPFEQSPLHRLAGQIAVRSERVTLAPKLTAAKVRAVLRLGATDFGLHEIDGTLAGGQLNGDLTFSHRADGLDARARIKVVAANATELFAGDGPPSGRLSFEATVEGGGMSAVALIGSLEGGGTFRLENARLARLDPAAFNAIIRAVERGLPIDADKLKERMELALAAGSLPVALFDGAIRVSSGQARLSPTSVQAHGADLAVNASVDMAQGVIDARLLMTGPGGAGSATRPEVVIGLKGPIEAPRRTTDVAMLATWLALRAVEQQSKKLDVLEGREPPAPVLDAPAAIAPAALPAEPKATGIEPEPGRPRPAVRSAPKSKPPAAEQAPALPPPIDIRPAPTPRPPRAAGPQTSQPQTSQPQTGQPQPPKPAAPARPRSLSEILFGN